MNSTQQTKLTKAEWNAIEATISDEEKEVLAMIISGYNNVSIKQNKNVSLLGYAKIEKNKTTETFIYTKFFKEKIVEIQKIHMSSPQFAKIAAFAVKDVEAKSLKRADTIRIENMTSTIERNLTEIIEFKFIEFILKMVSKPRFYLYTLIQLRNINVPDLNSHVMQFVDLCIEQYSANLDLSEAVLDAYEFIEKNTYIYKYSDITLYEHQKQLFSTFRKSQQLFMEKREKQSNLVLYIAPTGTGKTLSPIGLSNEYRIIFVCAARHVGMALAKSAISAHKCVAFAFGCDTANDIRLHYYSALNYKINKRSGGIGKVDNSVGDKVEIMICDAKSYLTAMYYMLSFNRAHEMITYWDEPTIAMDYEEHAIHEIIHQNWSENQIPNMVLSSATLPTCEELQPIMNDFRMKFDNVKITQINSYDCKKSISLINKSGFCVCPHLMYDDYRKTIECVEYCEQNRTLLRYFDLKEVVRFISTLKHLKLIPEAYNATEYFGGDLKNVNMNSIKMYYLELIKHIDEEKWCSLFEHIKTTQRRKFQKNESVLKNANMKKTTSLDSSSSNIVEKTGKSIIRTTSVSATSGQSYLDKAKEQSIASGGMLLTTVDAHTLTDGPTIYLAEDVDKIGNFYIQQSNIPKAVFDDIIKKITYNNLVMSKIAGLESALEDLLGKEMQKEKKMTAEEFSNPEAKRLDEQIAALKQETKMITLDSLFIPNTVLHQEIWISHDKTKMVENAFCPSIDPESVKQIMELDIKDGMKILLLLGIGVFSINENSFYTEIVKRLANEKRLFIIIASSDYIYGTNYQFCHGIIGKDLVKMTPQKTIQSLGRIGRGNIQQEYTARFRDDCIIENLFKTCSENMEARIMCKLLFTEESNDHENGDDDDDDIDE
jgi:hypothetical protein